MYPGPPVICGPRPPVMVTRAAVLPALGFPRPRPPAAAGSALSGGGGGPIGVFSRSAPSAIRSFNASTSDCTAARKNAELSNRSVLGIDVEWNWPTKTLFGSAPPLQQKSYEVQSC